LPLRNREKEEEMGKPKNRISEVRVSGPLAPFVPGFKAWLEEAGYTRCHRSIR